MINFILRYWTTALQFSLAIVNIVTNAILPERFFGEDTTRFINLGQLITASTLLLLFVPQCH